MYAVIKTGGKQYKVTEGQTIKVERLDTAEGGTVQLDKVLMLADGDNITVGKPLVEGARVMATVKQNGKSKKILVFKYKSKVRSRRKNGHRQLFTSLNIDKILASGVEDVKPVKRAPRKKKVEEQADGA